MNYIKIYQNLINNAMNQNREKHKGSYYETHHIKPRCIGGTNEGDNLVILTAKEHYIAHVLLAVIHKHSSNAGSLAEAVRMMKKGNGRTFTGAMFEKLRIQAAKSQANKIRGENHHLFKGYYCTPYGKFSSALAAEKVCDVVSMTVSRRCKSKSIRWKDWHFETTDGEILGEATDSDYYVGQNNHQSKGTWVTPHGTFASLGEGGNKLNCDPGTIRHRAYSKESKWVDWYLKTR